ncbi:heterokaryon incompatibility protein-domain-containing protein [Penicillium cosmopolitanum]|uniref:Heterokaryon incompatibility protein-domain-containing protein n=1 Tax=Penicillium cosmopolitanum TaxID=1131564 RepID=A0A9X0BCT0_9EURO|nr:heterokaryon incompatibility protein-domain-containing protein [Penicillium cosmopolitanum]KAJ5407926.1 heterokaryon incompatibility protein-domain-containing protein [Penicillium cosmopolitanum]
MRRWHKDGCQSPEIVLVDSNSSLHCKSCSALSSLDETTDAAQQNNRSPPPRTENQPLKWPAKARYLGEFSSAVEITQPPRKVSRVGSIVTQNEEVARPETLFDDEIRLIRLMPCENSDGPVHITWEKTHLREQPVQTYDAVSYTTAGGLSLWKPVFMGLFWDIIFVHSNCEAALRQIRSLGLTQLLWVDELCIDLDDVLERNHQAGLSREIYANAKDVLTFIGNSSPETGLVLENLKEANAGGVIKIHSSGSQRAWKCFSDLPIFSRVWIFQELLVGRHVVLISGGSATPWSRGTKITVPHNSATSSIVHRMIGNESLDNEFLDILLAASQYDCSDPRDKVFGVLGLADEAIRPDYSLSVEDIYTGIAAYLATYLGDMRILNFAGSKNRSNLDIPSWVPDWTQKQTLQFPSHEIDITDPGMEGMTALSFHGMVPSNIEILVDPKSRALQCSAIKLCSYDERWQLFSIMRESSYRRSVFPRDHQGKIVTNRHSIPGFFGFVNAPGPVTRQDSVSVFLLQGMDHPVILRYIPEKEAYSLLTTCVVSFRQPQTMYLPWEENSPDSSAETSSNVLDIHRMATEDIDGIVEFDSRVLDVIWRRLKIPLEPDRRTFFHATARFLDIVKIFFLEIRELEKPLRDSWKYYEDRLGLMFRDSRHVWSFVEYLGEQEDEIRGTEKMPRADKLNTAWTSLRDWKLPSEYTWDLERFCLSFVSGSSAPPVEILEDDDSEPEDLISHISDIRAWAETTEKLLRIMSFTEKHMSSSWPSFPGNDMARTWLAPFETGVWKWEKFRASLVARECIWGMLIPEELNPRVNRNIKMRLIMSQIGLAEEEKQITLI